MKILDAATGETDPAGTSAAECHRLSSTLLALSLPGTAASQPRSDRRVRKSQVSLLDASRHTIFRIQHIPEARLAQPVERKALNLVVVGSSPTVGVTTKLCVCLPLLAFVISGWLPDFLQPEYVLTQLRGRLILRALSCCVPPAVIDIAGLATAWHSSLAARQRQEGEKKSGVSAG